MNNPILHGQNPGSRAALRCAESFQRLATTYLERIATEVGEGTYAQVPEELGELVSSATTLALAIELYLKALHIQFASEYARTHDLRRLYDDLPADVRVEIESSYDASFLSIRPGDRGAITIAKGPMAPPAWSDYAKESKKLRDVLTRSRDVFVSWRYIFAPAPAVLSGGYEFHHYEYRLLLFACDAVRAAILSRQQKDGS